MDVTSKAFAEQVVYLGLGLVLALMINLLAFRKGFFNLASVSQYGFPISFRDVLGAFLFFLMAQAIIVPFGAYLWLSASSGRWLPLHTPITVVQRGWINLAATLVSAIAIAFYCLVIEKRSLKTIAGVNGALSVEKSAKDFAFGALTWIICYPTILAISQAIGIIVMVAFNPPQVDQVAVKYVKSVSPFPLLFWPTLASIIFIVPIVEEVIFRGYLQTWLKQKIGIGGAIALASLIFAVFHFAFSQGWHNIEFVITLFFLSCYLGFIYERQASIWAPIGLHVSFNAISILLLMKELAAG